MPLCCRPWLALATRAAMWRRQRRLRAWARHERLSIAMALATVEHHSYGPTANAAPRGQTTGTSAREGEVREQHCGLRAQKRPLPRMRPAPLSEVLPQVGLKRLTVEQRNSWWISSKIWTSRCPRRSSKCPRSHKILSLSALWISFHRLWNSWWKCRPF